MQVRRHRQQFQRHRDQMGSGRAGGCPRSVGKTPCRKMLVLKQMTQVVEVHSPVQDRWLTTACPSSGGRPRRSELVLWHWRRRVRRRAGSELAHSDRAQVWQWICVWDLRQRADQVKAEKRLSDDKPHLLIFECDVPVSLSRLQHAKPDELVELREQGKRHLEFACGLARLHIEQGGPVLFEYPLAASEEPCLWKLRSIDGMRCVRCDQCQFGMTSVGCEGNVGPACKATGFMTNDEYIAEAVNRHCFCGHDHIQLLSCRAKSCEKCPPRLVTAILCALRQSMRAAGRGEAQKMMGRDRQLSIAAVEAGRLCCRSLTMPTVIKSSETEALDCR